MQIPPKHFHVYKEDEDFRNQPDDIRLDFCVISSTAAYGGGCGAQGAGLERYSTMVGALSSQISWASEFDDEDVEEECAPVRKSIEEIEARGTDEGYSPNYLELSGRVEYTVHVAGYWPDFVRDALDLFEEEVMGQNDEEKMDTESLRAIRELKSRKDTQSDDFKEKFMDLMMDYEMRHC